MSLNVYLPPFPQHCYWKTIFNAAGLAEFLKDLRDPQCYFWVKNRQWADKNLASLLSALLAMDIPTLDLEVHPYKREIALHIKGPTDPGGGGPCATINYPSRITKTALEKVSREIAQIVHNYWKNRLEEPILTACAAFQACKKYL